MDYEMTAIEQRVSQLLRASHIERLPVAERDFVRACARFCMPAKDIYNATIKLRAWNRDRRLLRERLFGLTETELGFAFQCLDQGDSVEAIAEMIGSARGGRSYAIRLTRKSHRH
jgi:hypothetical protein